IEASRTAGDGAPHARGRLVAETVACVRAMHASDVLQRVIDVDPELLMPYVVDRIGSTQHIAVALLADGISRGHADGSIRTGPRDALAYGMLLTVQSFVLSARPVTAEVPAEQLYDELAHLLDSSLAAKS
ncbi:MAG: TetR/AcrR family transcriptional regulator, partial [Streptosporangiaceae bacterium]